ncbi:hypothetical protein [Paraburkholderia atlantica]|uniref:hypothetical protein n=1 Tax=Paraburkholderia atlantica TaxID=2654982 RepID=UPI00161C9AE0|nr:hypothetical protein [Paraburkholderia atlantica]MBB5508523.1 hypothetical protein [Paraburkholderia atlantica]
MVVGYKKLHDVSASRACPLRAAADAHSAVAGCALAAQITAVLMTRIMAGLPRFLVDPRNPDEPIRLPFSRAAIRIRHRFNSPGSRSLAVPRAAWLDCDARGRLPASFDALRDVKAGLPRIGSGLLRRRAVRSFFEALARDPAGYAHRIGTGSRAVI